MTCYDSFIVTADTDITHLADSLFDGIVQVDSRGRILLWNRGAERITGRPAGDLIGQFYQKKVTHFSDSGRGLESESTPLLLTLKDGVQREMLSHLGHADGFRVPILTRTVALRGRGRKLSGGIEVFTDSRNLISAFQSTRRADDTVLFDPLTGIGNRPHIEAKITFALEDLRAKNIRFGILFIDIDHFKNFNDVHGHLAGDKVLRVVANTLRHNLRVTDSCGRWGGEEFIALVFELDLEGLHTVAEKLRGAVAQTVVEEGREALKVTISIGGTLARPDDTLRTLIERADHLMYESKTGGRNLVTTSG